MSLPGGELGLQILGWGNSQVFDSPFGAIFFINFNFYLGIFVYCGLMDGRVCRLSIDEKFNSISNNKRNEILQNKDQEEAPEISDKFYFEEKHLSKVTCICYLEDLDYIISGGDDGIV